MKILVLIDLFPPNVMGGYELRCEEACHWLQQHGYQIEVLTTKSGDVRDDHPFPVHRSLFSYPLGKTPSKWNFFQKLFHAITDNLKFKRRIAKSKPDLIYVWNCQGISKTLIPVLFNSKTRKLVDVSSQWLSKVALQHGPVYRFLEREYENKIYDSIHTLIRFFLSLISFNTIKKEYKINFFNTDGYFTSYWNKDSHTNYLEQCRDFEVIYTGIDLAESPYSETKLNNTILQLLYVGRISKAKGFLLLLEQLSYLRKKSSKQVTLTVVGEYLNESEEKSVQETLVELSLKDCVIFKGKVPRDQLYKFYHQADFTVFTSLCKEAFSRIPLESMACGTPCLSTDNPGSQELFNIEAPLIYLGREKESLFRGIESFMDNDEAYINICRKGRNLIEESFTFDHFMNIVQKRFLSTK